MVVNLIGGYVGSLFINIKNIIRRLDMSLLHGQQTLPSKSLACLPTPCYSSYYIYTF